MDRMGRFLSAMGVFCLSALLVCRRARAGDRLGRGRLRRSPWRGAPGSARLDGMGGLVLADSR